MNDAAPETVGGRYRILGNVGKGAMGVVYMAHDPVLDRKVAIKQMTEEIARNEELRQRFYVEARAAARLNHPNIITIHELQEAGGEIYMVMELLDGKSLASLVQARPVPLSLEAALDVTAQVCDGLHYAHQHSIVHRDIKPANLFLTPGGTVKILDFGIARFGSMHMTAAGALVGTPDYMSPEQVRGDEIDRRTDLWAVGVLLYQLLSGVKPFEGKPLARLLTAITQAPHVPLSERVPSVSKAVSDLVDRLLAKPRDARPATAGVVRDELRAILGREFVSATRASLAGEDFGQTLLLNPEPPVMAAPSGQMAETRAAAKPVEATIIEPPPQAPPPVPPPLPPKVQAPAPAPAPVTPEPSASKQAPAAEAASAPLPAPAAAKAERGARSMVLAAAVLVGLVALAGIAGAGWWFLQTRGNPPTDGGGAAPAVAGPAAHESAAGEAAAAPPVAPASVPEPLPASAEGTPSADRVTTEPPAAAAVATPVSEEGVHRPAAAAADREAPPVVVPAPRAPAQEPPPPAPPAAHARRAEVEPPVRERPAQRAADPPPARGELSAETVAALSGRQSGEADYSTSPGNIAAINRIKYVLEQYAQGLSRRDEGALRGLRADISAEESRLLQARELRVALEDVRVEVDGTQASAVCRRTITGTSASGGAIREQRSVVVHLARRPAGWVIREIK